MRIGLHTGPVFEGYDAIIGRNNYFGSHVSRAARIEPVTAPGCAFVSEQFAAALALAPGHDFVCEYLGLQPLAKDYDVCPLYRLTSRTERIDPAGESTRAVDDRPTSPEPPDPSDRPGPVPLRHTRSNSRDGVWHQESRKTPYDRVFPSRAPLGQQHSGGACLARPRRARTGPAPSPRPGQPPGDQPGLDRGKEPGIERANDQPLRSTTAASLTIPTPSPSPTP